MCVDVVCTCLYVYGVSFVSKSCSGVGTMIDVHRVSFVSESYSNVGIMIAEV